MPYFKMTCSLNFFKSLRTFQFILKTQMLSEVLLFQHFDVKNFNVYLTLSLQLTVIRH